MSETSTVSFSGPPCPLCGAALQPVPTSSPQTPPWLCPADARGWWPAELTPAARHALRPALRDFGVGEPAALIELATHVHLDQLSAGEDPP